MTSHNYSRIFVCYSHLHPKLLVRRRMLKDHDSHAVFIYRRIKSWQKIMLPIEEDKIHDTT